MAERVKQQCKGTTYKRDTYRYTGRTKSGFEMHYIQGRCTRHQESPYCWQHAPYNSREMEAWHKAQHSG